MTYEKDFRKGFLGVVESRLGAIRIYARDHAPSLSLDEATSYVIRLDEAVADLTGERGRKAEKQKAYRKPALTREEYERIKDSMTNEEIQEKYRTSRFQIAGYRAWITRRGRKGKKKR